MFYLKMKREEVMEHFCYISSTKIKFGNDFRILIFKEQKRTSTILQKFGRSNH